MVLADLGKRLNSAIASLSSTSPIDEASLDLALRSISSALLSSDINVHLVQSLLQRIKAGALPQLVELNKKGEKGVDVTAGNRGKGIIQKVVVDELVRLVDGGGNKGVHEMKKGTTSVIMLVGLQGAGKTTTCTKLATHYTRRGFKTALVCADTFRAGAFDQLKQNAVKARVPFFGSYTETDPAAIAAAGVTKFRAERFDIIIVDTSGRHKQEAELFDEMVLIKEAVRPDLTVLVMDGGIGQAAEAQSKAFKEAAGFGAIIVTKLDGHAKGGGAISAVAATNTPIIFLGTGEHLHDLETFTPGPFISKMLGMGDMQGLVERAREMEEANPGRREGMMEKMATGVFSVRDLKEQMETIAGLGPLSNLTSMIPGMSDMMAGNEDEAGKKMRRMAFIFDAMSTFELDSDGSCFRGPVPSSSALVAAPSKGKETVKVANANGKDKVSEVQEGPREPNARVLRVARGSGTSVNEVEEILAQHQMFAGMVKKAGGKGGWMSKMKAQQSAMARRGGPGGAGGMPGMPDMANLSPGQLAQMQNMLPPGMREQMAQPGAMAQMAEMMKGMGGMGGLGGMMGGGGMPDMAKMMAGMGMGK